MFGFFKKKPQFQPFQNRCAAITEKPLSLPNAFSLAGYMVTLNMGFAKNIASGIGKNQLKFIPVESCDEIIFEACGYITALFREIGSRRSKEAEAQALFANGLICRIYAESKNLTVTSEKLLISPVKYSIAMADGNGSDKLLNMIEEILASHGVTPTLQDRLFLISKVLVFCKLTLTNTLPAFETLLDAHDRGEI